MASELCTASLRRRRAVWSGAEGPTSARFWDGSQFPAR